jgi:hypothetical protein
VDPPPSWYVGNSAATLDAVQGIHNQIELIGGNSSANITWVTDSIENTMAIRPLSPATAGERWYEPWIHVKENLNITRFACGDSGALLGYSVANNEWIRMNSAATHVMQNTPITCMFGLSVNDIWLGTGDAPDETGHSGYPKLVHLENGVCKSKIIPSQIDFDYYMCTSIHGNLTNNVYALFSKLAAGAALALVKWNGTAWSFLFNLGTESGFSGDVAAHKLYVLPNGNIYIIGAHVHFYDGSWNHETPGGSWDTSISNSHHVIGIGYDGEYIYVAKHGLGIWKGKYGGGWTKEYTFVDGEIGYRTDQLMTVDSDGNVYCGSNNGRIVRYIASTLTWSSTLI